MSSFRRAPILRGFRKSFLHLDVLESREVPATIVGLTTVGTLVSFDSDTPGTAIGSPVVITGLNPLESIVEIDFRPSTGTLFGVSDQSRLFRINKTSGVATPVGTSFTPTLTGSDFAVDFNPTVDKLRVISNTGQNLRIDPLTGQVVGNTADTAIAFDTNSAANTSFFGTTAGAPITPAPTITEAAYTFNFDNVTANNVATLYGIDATRDLLVQIGGPNGTPSPNGGLVNVINIIRDSATFATIDFGANAPFDIEAKTDAAFAVSGGTLYSINLANGIATSRGTVTSVPLRGLAIVSAADGPGTIQLSSSSYTFPADRSPLAITITRTDGATGPITVNYATADGTATNNSDYLPVTGTLDFDDGVTSQTVMISLPAGAPRTQPAETFNFSISNPTGGASLGSVSSSKVTIPASIAPLQSKIFGITSANTSQVAVFDGQNGTQKFLFNSFGGSFRGTINTTSGDFNGDGFEDLIVAAGPGGGPRVQLISGATLSSTNQTVLADFFGFESFFTGGVNVASGDINGDGFADLIIGAGDRGGPRIRVYNGFSLAQGIQTVIQDYFAIDSSFRGGVSVAAGEFTGDAFDDIVASASIGGGPRVQIRNGLTQSVVADYFAYDPNFRGGVNLAVGDVNGDGFDDVVTGPDFGGAPNVRAFSGSTTTSLANFFAFNSSLIGGMPVGALDLNGDGRAEILAAAGTDGQSNVRIFNAAGVTQANDLTPFGSARGGVFVG